MKILTLVLLMTLITACDERFSVTDGKQTENEPSTTSEYKLFEFSNTSNSDVRIGCQNGRSGETKYCMSSTGECSLICGLADKFIIPVSSYCGSTNMMEIFEGNTKVGEFLESQDLDEVTFEFNGTTEVIPTEYEDEIGESIIYDSPKSIRVETSNNPCNAT